MVKPISSRVEPQINLHIDAKLNSEHRPKRHYGDDAFEPSKSSSSSTRVWHFYLGGMEVYRLDKDNFELRMSQKGRVQIYPFVGSQNSHGETIARKWLKKPPADFGLSAPCTFSNAPLTKRSPLKAHD